MDDMISRKAAIDALTDTNLKRNVDSVCDGDMNRTRRAAQRVIAQLPAVDAIPVTWLEDIAGRYEYSGCTDSTDVVMAIIKDWKKEQEARM